MPTDTPHPAGFAAGPDQMLRMLADVQTAGLGSLSWLGNGWVEAMGDLGTEWLQFVANRVREDAETQRALLHATDIEEVRQIQARFLQKAMDDYHDETGRIVQLCSDAVADIDARARNG